MRFHFSVPTQTVLRHLPITKRSEEKAHMTLLTANKYAQEEMLIVDARTAIRPAQMVENKLDQILQGSFVGISHLRLRSLINHRTERTS